MLNMDMVVKLGSGGWDLIIEEEAARVNIYVVEKIILACISCFLMLMFYVFVFINTPITIV